MTNSLHSIDEQLLALKEKLHGTVGNHLDHMVAGFGNCLNHMVAGFGQIREALGEQVEREKLWDNETGAGVAEKLEGIASKL